MQGPACSFEEFLRSHNLDEWPRYPYIPEVDVRPLITTLRNNYSLDNITQYLYDNVPFSTENLSNLEAKVEECKIKVHEHAKKIVHMEGSDEEKDQPFPEQDMEPGAAASSKDFLVMRRKKKIVKFESGTMEDSRSRKAENYKFPGFQAHHLTDLPCPLEAVHLWNSILKIQAFKGLNVKVLKKLFLSEASIALLQDCFWWWFLHKYKPDQGEQDHLFDRISDSFVALLLSTPNYIKDAFFQMYPDCLSQAIYLTFYEAFPNSHFGDQFKEDLMDLIFQWIRGFKPQKFAWKKWNLWCLERPAKLMTKRDSIRLSVGSLFPRERRKSLRFQMVSDEYLKGKLEEPKPESHYVGDGPDFHRLQFNLGGQSPLVLYYLKMHGISNSLENSRHYKITRTEVCKEPPDSPTYRDVIEESKKFTKRLHDDFLDFQHRCIEELTEIEMERLKVNRKFQRLLVKLSKNPNELRLRTQALIQKLQENPAAGQASSGAANSMAENAPMLKFQNVAESPFPLK